MKLLFDGRWPKIKNNNNQEREGGGKKPWQCATFTSQKYLANQIYINKRVTQNQLSGLILHSHSYSLVKLTRGTVGILNLVHHVHVHFSDITRQQSQLKVCEYVCYKQETEGGVSHRTTVHIWLMFWTDTQTLDTLRYWQKGYNTLFNLLWNKMTPILLMSENLYRGGQWLFFLSPFSAACALDIVTPAQALSGKHCS